MKPNESDLSVLRNYIKDAPSQYSKVLDRPPASLSITGEPMHLLAVSTEQRNLIVRALDCLRDVNSK